MTGLFISKLHMWVHYCTRSIKENKTSSFFISLISLISSLLLSLFCGIFYNLWIDWINRNNVTMTNVGGMIKPLTIAYILIQVFVCISIISMIHHAFQVYMNDKLHQLGIFESVGATPRQIQLFLLMEVFLLCLLPVILGIGSGILLSYGFVQIMISVGKTIRNYEAAFYYHPFVAIVTFLISIITVMYAAWIPAKKISKIPPLKAIHFGGQTSVNETYQKHRQHRFLLHFFGVEGQLAGKSIYARKNILRTSNISLILAFLGLLTFLNVECISGMSTQRTYFEKYQSQWDIMLKTDVVQKNEDMLLKQIREMEGVEACTSYQVFDGTILLNRDDFSEELKQNGVENLLPATIALDDGAYLTEARFYVLDEESFMSYCRMNRANYDPVQKNYGAVVINHIWDSVHSDRRHKTYIPYLNDDVSSVNLQCTLPSGEQKEYTFDITGRSASLPDIKEEEQSKSLSVIISNAEYHSLGLQNLCMRTCYNITTDEALHTLPKELLLRNQIEGILDQNMEYSIESRLDEQRSDQLIRDAMKFFVISFATILAGIGVANVFSATLGQIYQRKKE
ncbi:MAG: ABC transporter permease, partial [Clostridia bacterium]|nr:ABC transporter permease [Clostridia bacterium]